MKLLLILTLLLTFVQAKQKDFSLIVDIPFDAALLDITQDYDRTLTAVGFSKNFKSSSDDSRSYSDPFEYLSHISSKYGSQMHIIKVDNQANIIFSKNAKLSRFNKAVAVVKTPSNGYFIGGYTMDGSLLVTKLDSSANILFTKTFGTKNYDRMSNLILLSDGGILSIGSSTTSREMGEDIFKSGLGNSDIFLTRFSKDGRKLWSKKYGTKYDDNGIDAVETNDGSIIVIGTTSYYKNRDVTLMRITENGNRIWLKHYQKEDNNDNSVLPKKIIKLKDNNFLIALTQYNTMNREHIRLIKFDLYQNILIDKEIFTTYPSEIHDIKEYSNGKIIAVGYVKDSYDTDGLAMIFDSNLLLLKQDHFGDENYDIFNAVTITNNSQAAIAGLHTKKGYQETNMWITKLSSELLPIKLLTSKYSFYKQLCKIFEDEIEKKQLKINEDLTIDFLDKRLLFSVGEYKLNSSQKLFLNKFSSKLFSFLYKEKAQVKTFEINGHTSSEWGNSSFSTNYLNNAKLSLNRSFSVMSYIFQQQNAKTQNYLVKILKESGNSYKNKISNNNVEDKKKSRRVTFRIILK
jgi:outer membrane protein OmpA-like peptidoglycan-associated protein